MITTAAIALALCLQFNPTPTPSPLPPQAADLCFLEAQAEFVRSATYHPRWSDVLSPAEVAIVRRLGCTHYACRADAQHDLAGLPDGGLWLILWGRYATDAETKDFCKRRWRRMFNCERCGGTGLALESEQWEDLCRECKGTGDVRAVAVHTGWLPDGRDIYVAVERPLAAGRQAVTATATVEPVVELGPVN